MSWTLKLQFVEECQDLDAPQLYPVWVPLSTRLHAEDARDAEDASSPEMEAGLDEKAGDEDLSEDLSDNSRTDLTDDRLSAMDSAEGSLGGQTMKQKARNQERRNLLTLLTLLTQPSSGPRLPTPPSADI